MYEREPCPTRIFNDTGGGLLIGAIFGTMFHFCAGMIRGVPGRRFVCGMRRARKNVWRTTVSFATWGCGFSVYDCLFSHLRQKDDIWNPIMAGTLVGATLPARRGKFAMIIGATGGFLILSVIEGLNIWFSRRMMQDQGSQYPMSMPGAGAPGGQGDSRGAQVYQ